MSLQNKTFQFRIYPNEQLLSKMFGCSRFVWNCFLNKEKGSNNRSKQKLKVAKIHERITNLRRDFQHKLSSKLIHENQVICIEDLSVKNMLKNHKLAKVIQDSSWSSLSNILKQGLNLVLSFGTNDYRHGGKIKPSANLEISDEMLKVSGFSTSEAHSLVL